MKIRLLFAFLVTLLVMPANSYAQEYGDSGDAVYVEDSETYGDDTDASGSYEEETDQDSSEEEDSSDSTGY